MPSYFIHMNQGLAADLRIHTICSGQFSTCAPIVFYNSESHWGGLYHLGGCDNLNEMTTTHLRFMETMIRPTVIYVLCGDSMDDLFGASGHVEPVRSLFHNATIHTEISGKQSFRSISVRENLDKLEILPKCTWDNKLNTKRVIDNLPKELKFVGEDDDNALKMWI